MSEFKTTIDDFKESFFCAFYNMPKTFTFDDIRKPLLLMNSEIRTPEFDSRIRNQLNKMPITSIIRHNKDIYTKRDAPPPQ